MNESFKRPRGRPRKHPSDMDSAPVQALERGLSLLMLLSEDRGATLSELALRAGMPPSTAHRLLMTLQGHRFAAFDETTQNWMIGIEAYRVGAGFLRRVNLVETARPIMQALVEDTGETANLALPDNGEVVFIQQVEAPNPIRAFFPPGSRSHMHASGAGKALMALQPRDEVEAQLQRLGLPTFTASTITKPDALFAELARIRENGWAFDDQERYVGMSCIAAPIWGPNETPLAAVSVSGPSSRFTDQTVTEFSVRVRAAAKEISQAMGGGDFGVAQAS